MADYHSTHTGNIIDAAISAVIAGQAGIQGVKVNGVELTPDLDNKVDVSIPEAGIQGVKVNGDELKPDLYNKVDVLVPILLDSTGQSTTAGMTQKAITDAIGSSTSGIAGVKVNGVELEKDAENKVDVPVPEAGIQGVKVNGDELKPDSDNKVDVLVPILLDSTGQSTTAGMTQKAITDALSSKADSSSLSQVATSGSYDDLSDKPTIPTLLSNTGQSTTAGMTQKAVTDELDKKSELHTYYVVADKDDWVGQSAPYTQVFNMGVTPIGDVFFADLGSEITVDSLEDWSCISSVDVTGNVVTLKCLEDKPKDDLVVYFRGFTSAP